MSTRIDFATLSLMDALDLAVLIEYEAFDRYKTFAQQLGPRFPGDAANAFVSMADNEAKHGKALDARRKERFGDAPRRLTLDDLYGVEAPEVGAIRSNMSAMEAFQVALAAERRAHDFYDEALKHVQDPDIRELFTELREEETEHVAMVQAIIAKLPPEASFVPEEDEDDLPML